MSTALADLQRWMDAARESEHLEFKEAKDQYDTTKLMKYCVAIGNEGGGQFVLGVTDKPPRKIAWGAKPSSTRPTSKAASSISSAFALMWKRLLTPMAGSSSCTSPSPDSFYGITNLGAILFAKRLDEFPTAWRKASRVIVFEGMGKLATKLDRPESKGYAVGFAGLIDLIFSRSEERPRLANRSVAGVDFQDRALQSPGGAGIVSSPRLRNYLRTPAG